ncbi:MAG: CBS domain-containing protein [gamma proteobacterium symbiont of Bathyaustriella thionipta]|nr:CBS domain-containing protein [gamma proteobacterium symbiont of Bathyaustriella thionipta]
MSNNKLYRVKDVMKTDFDLVDGKETVCDALRKMKHTDTHALIVDKRHADDEYGIVLLADIAKKVIAKSLSPERTNVYEVMSKPVLCVSARMDIRYCARLFERFGLTRAPAVENDEIVGIVSYNDMVLKKLEDSGEL